MGALKGYADARARLGICYEDGSGVERDLATALRWLQKAAAQGNPLGQFALGVMYAGGEGGAADPAQAATLFRLAAMQAFAPSETALGFAYLSGNGASQDDDKAVKWIRQGAEANDDVAQTVLASMYVAGYAVPGDYGVAASWYCKAAHSGNAVAGYYLGMLYEQGRGVSPRTSRWRHSGSKGLRIEAIRTRSTRSGSSIYGARGSLARTRKPLLGKRRLPSRATPVRNIALGGCTRKDGAFRATMLPPISGSVSLPHRGRKERGRRRRSLPNR